MSYQMVIEPEAEADLAEAYRWYESQRSGLGDEFIACVDAALDRICKAPELHAAVYRDPAIWRARVRAAESRRRAR